MIPRATLTAFLATTDLDRSTEFFTERVGLTLMERSPHAVVYDGLGAQLRVTVVETKADAPYTVLGWEVDDVEAAVDELRKRGVTFERFAGMDQDEHDSWTAPDGSRVAWFRDPDGNTLSLHGPGGPPAAVSP